MDTILALSITFAVTGFFVWRDRKRASRPRTQKR